MHKFFLGTTYTIIRPHQSTENGNSGNMSTSSNSIQQQRQQQQQHSTIMKYEQVEDYIPETVSKHTVSK